MLESIIDVYTLDTNDVWVDMWLDGVISYSLLIAILTSAAR